jgi:hypothetical protein
LGALSAIKVGDEAVSNGASLFPPAAARPFDGDPTGERHEARESFATTVATFFKARPGQWIDGRDIQEIAGCYGWRTRISDCRRPPYSLNIVNRQRRVGRYIVSEYMLPTDAQDLGGAA